MPRGKVAKVSVLLAACAFFAAVLIISDPERSAASISSQPVPGGSESWLDESGRWPMVGELSSSDHLVRVYATESGPIYTVCSAEGEVIKSGLTGDEVGEHFPDLDLSGTGDDGYLLMLVETDL